VRTSRSCGARSLSTRRWGAAWGVVITTCDLPAMQCSQFSEHHATGSHLFPTISDKCQAFLCRAVLFSRNVINLCPVTFTFTLMLSFPPFLTNGVLVSILYFYFVLVLQHLFVQLLPPCLSSFDILSDLPNHKSYRACRV